MSRVPLLVSSALLMSTVACGSSRAGGPEPAGDEPVTQRALAAIAADVLGEPTKAGPWSNTSSMKADGLAASVDLGDDGVTVIVGRGISDDGPSTDCEENADDTDDGSEERDGVTVSWQEEEPEEDPGIVVVHADRSDGGDVVVYYYPSVPISDPRRQDLPIALDDLIALAKDPRIGLTTSQETIDAGEDLSVWEDEG